MIADAVFVKVVIKRLLSFSQSCDGVRFGVGFGFSVLASGEEAWFVCSVNQVNVFTDFAAKRKGAVGIVWFWSPFAFFLRVFGAGP